MTTTLHYLGAFESVAEVENAYHRERGSSETFYAFGWAWLTFGRAGTVGQLVRAMIAWIPSNDSDRRTEQGTWPVYIDESSPPDTRPMSNWLWDGHMSAPTLTPSILKQVEPTIGGAGHVLAHGYIKNGAWEPC